MNRSEITAAKAKKRRTVLGLILAGAVLFSLCFEFFHLEYLCTSPFEYTLRWESPVSAHSNDKGYTAVIDSAGARIILLSPDGTVDERIQHTLFQSVTPVNQDNVFIGSDTITVIDHTPDENHVNGYYDRLLVYDFDGKYVGTPYSDKDSENIAVYSIAVQGSRMYAAASDLESSSIIIGEIRDEKLVPIHEYDCDYADIFGIRYNPRCDTTTLLGSSGNITTWSGEKRTEYSFSEAGYVISDAAATDSGMIAAIDSNGHSVIVFDSVDNVSELAPTEALNLGVCGDTVIYADQNNNSIGYISINTGKSDVINDTGYSKHIVATGIITWIIFIIGALSLIILIISLISAIVRKAVNSGKTADNTAKAHGQIQPLTNLKVYGPLMGVAFVAFAITSLMIGCLTYSSAIDKSEVAVEDVALSVSEISSDTFGDNLDRVSGQQDFGNTDYCRAVGYVELICSGNRSIEGSSLLNCSLYKFTGNSGDMMVIRDCFGQMKTGTVLSEADQIKQGFDEITDTVLQGNIWKDYCRYSSGLEYYEACSPVFDSHGSVTGFTVISTNETQYREQILQSIMMRVIQAFTLLFGLVLLLVEFGLAGRFLKIKKENIRNGITDRTVPEAYRTMDVIFKIPQAMFIIFINSIVDDILAVNGQEETFLLVALPITVNAAAFFVFRIILGPHVKYSPKKYAWFSAAGTIGASLMLLYSMKGESYLMLNAGAALMGTAAATGLISAKSIRLTTTPSTKYLNIVIERKGVLATAIAASIGTVLRTLFGKTALIWFMIFIALVAIAAASLFMCSDINVPRNETEHKKNARWHFAVSRRMMKRPNTFAFMLMVALPLPFLSLLGSYGLPQINSFYGLPEVLIGAISIIVSIVTLFTSSFLWVHVRKRKDETWPPVMMGTTAAALFLFSLITTMSLFILLLIVIALCESILLALLQKQIIIESEKEGLDAIDTSPLHEFFMAIGVLIGPAVMTASLMINIRMIGIVWGSVCAICAIASYFVFSRKH